MAVKPIPEGYHTVTPYFVVRGVGEFLDFVQRAFAAAVRQTTKRPDGQVVHAEFRIGDSMLMAGEASDRWPPLPGGVYLYVLDVDAVYRSALAAGAESVMEPTTQFYGDRNGGVQDKWGNYWWIGTHVEDVSPDEIARRAAAKWQQ